MTDIEYRPNFTILLPPAAPCKRFTRCADIYHMLTVSPGVEWDGESSSPWVRWAGHVPSVGQVSRPCTICRPGVRTFTICWQSLLVWRGTGNHRLHGSGEQAVYHLYVRWAGHVPSVGQVSRSCTTFRSCEQAMYHMLTVSPVVA